MPRASHSGISDGAAVGVAIGNFQQRGAHDGFHEPIAIDGVRQFDDALPVAGESFGNDGDGFILGTGRVEGDEDFAAPLVRQIELAQ